MGVVVMSWYKCWACGTVFITEHAEKCSRCKSDSRLVLIEPEFVADFFGEDYHNFEGEIYHTTVSC